MYTVEAQQCLGTCDCDRLTCRKSWLYSGSCFPSLCQYSDLGWWYGVFQVQLVFCRARACPLPSACACRCCRCPCLILLGERKSLLTIYPYWAVCTFYSLLPSFTWYVEVKGSTVDIIKEDEMDHPPGHAQQSSQWSQTSTEGEA